jgi:hypothetical protein
MRPSTSPRVQSRRARLFTSYAVLLGLALGALPVAADTVSELVQQQRIREMKELQRQLNMEGAHRRRVKLREYAKAWVKAERKGLPTPGPFRAKQAYRGDEPVLRTRPLERDARPAALQAIQAIPSNVPASDRSLDVLPGSGQSESAVAIHGSNVIVAWNDGDGFGGGSQDPHVQGIGYSTDGGATFTDIGAPPAPGGIAWTSDPVMTVNEATGEFWYCGLLNPTGVTNGIGIIRGTFSGNVLTWDTPLTAVSVSSFTNFTDKQWMVADSSNGNLYITYTDFFASGNRIYFRRSTDNGVTWSAPLQMNGAPAIGLVQGSRPVVGPDGEVYVVWKELGASAEDLIRVRKSVNAGATFGTQITAVSYYDNFGTGAPGFNRERAVSFPSIAVDRSTGPNRGRVYIAYHESFNYYDDALSTGASVVESEANNNSASADPFTIGSLIRGNLANSDQDWYSFSATAGTNYVFFIDSIPAPLYSFRIFCSDGVQQLSFAGDLNAPAGGTSVLVWTAPTTGTYFLRLFWVTGAGTGNYRLHTGVGNTGLERGRDHRDAFVATSDNGTTWAAPVRVNDDLDRFDNWLPEVIVGSDGCPYVMWFDWRDDNTTCAGRSHIYVSRSGDGGATWDANQRATDVLADWTGSFTNIAPNQGDYSHMAAGNATVGWTWADPRNSDADAYYAGVSLAHAISVCQSDVPGDPSENVPAHFEVDNLNVLFGNDYTYTFTDERGWPLPGGNLSVAAAGSGDIDEVIAVPDTADAGTNEICLSVTNSKGTLTAECCFTLTVGATADVPGGVVAFGLRSIAPNPSSGPANISFGMPREGRVSLVVYGLRGERIRTLADGTWSAGAHTITWDGRDDAGHPMRPGTYFVRLEGLGQSSSQRFVKVQ